jgi:GNAT superfamily N-acetyltransferase
VDLGARRRAKISDTAAIYALLTEATQWLAERRVRQWQHAYPLQRFAAEVERGLVWCWGPEGAPAATITVLDGAPEYHPPDIWPETERGWFLCRFAVARRLAGHGVGERLLAELERDARAAGVSALRLDVVSSNPFLERYYLARGFELAGQIAVFGEDCTLMEKRLP